MRRIITILCIFTLLLMSSCAYQTDGFKTTLCLVNDEREDTGYEMHLLLYHEKTGKSAILIIPGETVIDGRIASELGQNSTSEDLQEVIGDLLGISVDYTAKVDTKDAFALFTILDSLEAFDHDEENGYVELYRTRWATLYRNAKLLASEQVIDKILVVTGDIPERKVREFLLGIGNREQDEPILIDYSIDIYDRPLYNGMYGMELMQDIMRRLSE